MYTWMGGETYEWIVGMTVKWMDTWMHTRNEWMMAEWIH